VEDDDDVEDGEIDDDDDDVNPLTKPRINDAVRTHAADADTSGRIFESTTDL
jgi:hypothetical protein